MPWIRFSRVFTDSVPWSSSPTAICIQPVVKQNKMDPEDKSEMDAETT